MGDAPVAYVEGAGGTRVAEDEVVAVGKNDVCLPSTSWYDYKLTVSADIVLQSGTVAIVLCGRYGTFDGYIESV